MATTCPWQVTVTASSEQPASPTLQEIMDEELAGRLQDEEWIQLAAHEDSDAFDFEESDEDLEEKQSAPAQQQDDRGDDNEADYDLTGESYDDDIGEGKAYNWLRESMRQQAKHQGHRDTFLARSRVDLGKNGSGAHDNLLDERTQDVLRKVMRKDLVTAVKTRVHTDRESTVFHGVGLDNATGLDRELAIKVFKVNRGDFAKATECDQRGRRFGLDFVKKAMRRQLKVQAEREYKYLSRGAAALAPETVTETEAKLASAGRGARVPRTIFLREHMLATEFVGSEGHLAPSLEEAGLNGTQLRSAYTDLLRAVRQLYQRARLVHGHLSAASIRYHDGQCWIMGLGDALEASSENSAVFLTRDLDSLDSFFRSCGVPAVTKHQVGLLSVEVAKQYVLTESPEQLLRRFPVLEPLLRD
jgi:serine/threonine-protein kinase RIO1